MTDRALAEAITEAADREQALRTYLASAPCQAQLAEHDAALVALRHVVASRKALESWMSARACRAAHRRTA